MLNRDCDDELFKLHFKFNSKVQYYGVTDHKLITAFIHISFRPSCSLDSLHTATKFPGLSFTQSRNCINK